MNPKNKLFFSLIALLYINSAVGQGVSQTPYGQFGIGELETIGNTRHFGMGGAGVSLVSARATNIKNPATLGFNRGNVILDAGFYGKSNFLSLNGEKQSITNGNIQNLALLVPVSSKNYTFCVGINPYSNANTRFDSYSDINGDSTRVIYNKNIIEGGLNRIFFNQGIKLSKNLALGLGINYILGTINRTNEGYLYNKYPLGIVANQSTYTTFTERELYRFVEFVPAVSYYTYLSENYILSLGATASFNQSFNTSRKYINQVNNLANTYKIYGDTVVQKNNNITLPQQYILGASFTKASKWLANVEYVYTDYSKFESFSSINPYTTGHKIMLGGEYIPSYNAIRGYLKRMVYRGGVYYEQLPIRINSNQIQDVGLSTGVGLPLGKQNAGYMDFSFQFGRRGAMVANTLQENYIRFYVGIVLNDKWFIRYKLD
jgi:opacity protein-like surface antigen